MRKFVKSLNRIGFLILFLPFIYLFLWFNYNNQLPGNDASNYLLTAITIFYKFEKGVLVGLYAMFMDRGWRPILFSNIIVPFLLFFKGNLYYAYVGLAAFCAIITVIYLYLFFRLILIRSSALIATSLIALLPLVQAQWLMFYAEGAFFACVIASLFHLIRSDFFNIKIHSLLFGFWTSLAILIRPVEAFTHLLPVFIYYCAVSLARSRISVRQVVQGILLIFFAIYIFFLSAVVTILYKRPLKIIDGGHFDINLIATLFNCLIGIFLLTISLGYIYSIFCRKQRSNIGIRHNYMILSFSMILIITLAWYLPFAFETFQWIYRTSLGDIASSTGSLTGSSFSMKELYKYFISEGGLVVTVLTAMSIISLFCVGRKIYLNTLISLPCIFLILLAPIPFWEAFYTVQVVTRKLSLAFPAILMVMIILSLQSGFIFYTRKIILTFMTILQFALLVTLLFADYQRPSFFLKNTIGYFVPEPSHIIPNPHAQVASFLIEQSKQYHLENIGLEVNPGTPDARHPVTAEPVDPFLLSTMLFFYKKHDLSNYPYFSTYSDTDFRELNKKYDAIFLSDRIDNMKVSQTASLYYQNLFDHEQSQSLKYFYNLLYYYSTNQLTEMGWHLGPCILITTQSHGIYTGCLLLSSIKFQKVLSA